MLFVVDVVEPNHLYLRINKIAETDIQWLHRIENSQKIIPWKDYENAENAF